MQYYGTAMASLRRRRPSALLPGRLCLSSVLVLVLLLERGLSLRPLRSATAFLPMVAAPPATTDALSTRARYEANPSWSSIWLADQ